MYQGKQMQRQKYNKRRANKRKAIVLLTSLVLLIALLVGTTIAFLITSDEPITNTFNPSQVSCEVNEESFNNEVKTNVTISNTGDTEAYIRAAIIVTWKDSENGNVYGAAPIAGKDYTIDLNLTEWIEGSDGYYYYRYPVAPKDKENSATSVLINRCFAIHENTPAGYGLNVEILGSAIQSVPVSVVNEKWPAVKVDMPHGELTKVIKEGTQ